MIKMSNLSFYCNSFITLVRLKQNFQLYSCKLFCFFDEDHLGGIIITGVQQLTHHGTSSKHSPPGPTVLGGYNLQNVCCFLLGPEYHQLFNYSYRKTKSNQVPVSNFK